MKREEGAFLAFSCILSLAAYGTSLRGVPGRSSFASALAPAKVTKALQGASAGRSCRSSVLVSAASRSYPPTPGQETKNPSGCRD